MRPSFIHLTAIGLGSLAVAIPAAAAPAVAPGWPVMAPANGGALHQGPAGGLFVVGRDNDFGAILTEYRKSGKRVSEREDSRGCGNCDPRTYELWSVSRAGVGDQCIGDVDAAGRCAGLEGSHADFVLRAHRPGSELWTLPLPRGGRYHPASTRDYPEPTVRDGAGISYARMWAFDPPDADFAMAPRLISVSRSGRLRWIKEGIAGRALAGLRRGAVVFTPRHGARGLTPAGKVRWTVRIKGGEAGATDRNTPTAISDLRRNRVYIFEKRTRTVHAIDGATGVTKWRTRASDLLGIGKRGTVYISRNSRSGPSALRALNLAGKLSWQQRTIEPVTGAVEIADGRVAVSTAGDASLPMQGVVTLLNPRRSQERLPVGRARLSRGTIYQGEGPKKPKTFFNRANRTILRLDLRRPSRVRTRVIDSRGRVSRDFAAFGLFRGGSFAAPAGTSFTSLDLRGRQGFAGEKGTPTGSYRLEVRWREGSRAKVARLPFVLRK